MMKKRRRYKIFTALTFIKDYLHLIDMAKDKTVLQMFGFAYGEREITFASQRVFTTLPLAGLKINSSTWWPVGAVYLNS